MRTSRHPCVNRGENRPLATGGCVIRPPQSTGPKHNTTSRDSETGPPEAVEDGGCRKRLLLAQRRACCPRLPRGLVRVPATRAPPSGVPAPRHRACRGEGLQIGGSPNLATSYAMRCRGGSFEFRTSALSPGLLRGLIRMPG